MLIIRSDVPEYKCVKRDHHIGIRHLCKITYCRILFTTEKKLTEIWGSSSLLPRFCNLTLIELFRLRGFVVFAFFDLLSRAM